jgi:hypothetical protein
MNRKFLIIKKICIYFSYTEWLNSIPNFCFPSIENRSSLNPKLFDIDECLISFKKIDMVYFNMDKKMNKSNRNVVVENMEVEDV